MNEVPRWLIAHFEVEFSQLQPHLSAIRTHLRIFVEDLIDELVCLHSEMRLFGHDPWVLEQYFNLARQQLIGSPNYHRLDADTASSLMSSLVEVLMGLNQHLCPIMNWAPVFELWGNAKLWPNHSIILERRYDCPVF